APARRHVGLHAAEVRLVPGQRLGAAHRIGRRRGLRLRLAARPRTGGVRLRRVGRRAVDLAPDALELGRDLDRRVLGLGRLGRGRGADAALLRARRALVTGPAGTDEAVRLLTLLVGLLDVLADLL